jgi:cytochrome c553
VAFILRVRSILTPALLTAGLLCFAPVLRASDIAGSSPSFDKDVRPLIVQNCVSCHNAEKKKGDLDLSQFATADKAKADEEAWQEVADRLRDGDMPPKKAKRRPNDEERKTILAWIDQHIAPGQPDCGKIATDKNQKFYRGYVMSRRLTREEYNNSIRDLFGFDFHLVDLLPSDGAGGEGFDTDGDALFISALSMEKYLQAADSVMTGILPDGGATLSPDLKSAQERLLIARPGTDLPPRDAARQVVASFARRAFRRPVSDPEVDRLMSLFDRAQSRGATYDASLRLAIKSVLISPNFLFLAEPAPAEEGVYQLGDYPLASRLSYFLWSSMPDDELMSLAGKGRLHDQTILRQQVRRMIKDERSIALAHNFAGQWLGVAALGETKRPDTTRYPEFTDTLAADERQEVVLFFDSIVRNDQSVLDLLDARYTFVNGRLARLYGIPNVHGPEMRKVDLPDSKRGGVMTMAAVLTSTSYPLRTSPVLRGKWVLEQLLGERIPPPPPTAGQLPPDDHQTDGLTLRQRLEKHRSMPECASCHARMDPLGFGMENFDAIGRWRTTQAAGEPIDSSGVLSDGTKFDGPQQLRGVLIRRKGEFLYNFSRKMLGYALGRSLNRFDECVIKDGVAAMEADGDKPGALLETIVLSAPFQYRYVKK